MSVYIKNVSINNIRNITLANLELGKSFNFFKGFNGSGKTSILESIYMLSTGSSFRTKSIHKVINSNNFNCVVSGELYNHDTTPNTSVVGLERWVDGTKKIKISGENAASIGELARLLPLNLINGDSTRIIDGESKIRRQFLDWNLFHVEHKFYTIWRDFNRILLQRNSCCKQSRENKGKVDLTEILFWDEKFISVARQIDLFRKNFIEEFSITFANIAKQILPQICIDLIYLQGWEDNLTLEEAIVTNRGKDCAIGFSTNGPHRADLSLTVNNKMAKDLLSRGQKKLLTAALLIARAVHMQKNYQKKCIFLVDDIQAELDSNSSAKLMQVMLEIECQVLITGVDTRSLIDMIPGPLSSMFHVEHGIISGY
jgi:DNA replication and repair protein RecF